MMGTARARTHRPAAWLGILVAAIAAATATAAEPDRALLRACVEEHAEDTSLGAIGVGEFCTCYATEVANDPDLTPSPTLRGPTKRGEEDKTPPKALYYSERQEKARERAHAALHDGHKAYCRRLLQPGVAPVAPQAGTAPLDPAEDMLAPLRGLDGLIGP